MNKEDYCKFQDFLKEHQDLREIQNYLGLVNSTDDEKEERIASIMNYVDNKLDSPDRLNIIVWLKSLLPDLQLGDCIDNLDNNNNTNENSFFESSESSLSEYSHANSNSSESYNSDGEHKSDPIHNRSSTSIHNRSSTSKQYHSIFSSTISSSTSSIIDIPPNSNVSSAVSEDDEDSNSLDDQFINFSESLDAITDNFCGLIKDEISGQLKDIQDHIEQPTKGRGIKSEQRNESILNYVKEEHKKNINFLNFLCSLQNSESILELGIFKELQTWIDDIDEKTLNEIDKEKSKNLSKKKNKYTIGQKKANHKEELTKMENWYISLKTAPAVINTQKLSICTFNIKKFSKNNNKGVCIDKNCKNNLINCRCGFNKRRNMIASIFKEEIKIRGLKAFDIIAIQEALSDAQNDVNNQPIKAIKGLVEALNNYSNTNTTYQYVITSQSIGFTEYGVFIYNQKRLKCITISTGYPITETEMKLKDTQLLKTCFGGNDLTKNNIKEKLSESTNFRLPTYGLFQLINSFKKFLICSVHFKSSPSIELELIDDLIPHSPQKLYEEKQIYSVLCGDFNFQGRKSTLSNKHFCSGLDLQNNSTNLAHFFAGEKKCYDNIYFLNIKNYKTKIQRELSELQSDMNSKIIIEEDEQKEELNKAFIFALNRNFFTKVEEEQMGRIIKLYELSKNLIADKFPEIADTIYMTNKERDRILEKIVKKSSGAMTTKVNRFKDQVEKIGTLDLFTIASFLFSDHLPVGVILDI